MTLLERKEGEGMENFWIEALKKLTGPLVIALAILFITTFVIPINITVAIILAVLAAILTMFVVAVADEVTKEEIILFFIALGAIILVVYILRGTW